MELGASLMKVGRLTSRRSGLRNIYLSLLVPPVILLHLSPSYHSGGMHASAVCTQNCKMKING